MADEQVKLSAEASEIYRLAAENWSASHQNEGLGGILQAVLPSHDTERFLMEAGAELLRQSRTPPQQPAQAGQMVGGASKKSGSSLSLDLLEAFNHCEIDGEMPNAALFDVPYELADRIRAALAQDNPDFDATDGAHPAWWRAHDYTVSVLCVEINAILDGEDKGHGVCFQPWERTRRRLLNMPALTHTQPATISSDNKQTLINALAEIERLKGELECTKQQTFEATCLCGHTLTMTRITNHEDPWEHCDNIGKGE